MTEEEVNRLTKEEAHSEAITVRKIESLAVSAWERAYREAASRAEDPADKQALQEKLREIQTASPAQRLELASQYLDSMRERDETEYRLTIDLYEQVEKLEIVTGKKQAGELLADFNHEIKVTERRIFRELQGARSRVFVSHTAFAGEAIGNMARRPAYQEIPTDAFGRLFSIYLAQAKLAKHASKKEESL